MLTSLLHRLVYEDAMADSSFLSPPEDPAVLAGRLMGRAHNRDGLPEITIGLLFLVTAGLAYAQVVLPPGSSGFTAAVLGFALGLPVLFFAALYAVRWVRRRFLIERVGYVEPNPTPRRRYISGAPLLMLALVAAIIAAAFLFPFSDRWILAATGLLGAALQIYIGSLIRLRRLMFQGAVMAATGLVLAYLQPPLGLGMAELFAVQGTVVVVCGIVVLAHFLRQPVERG